VAELRKIDAGNQSLPPRDQVSRVQLNQNIADVDVGTRLNQDGGNTARSLGCDGDVVGTREEQECRQADNDWTEHRSIVRSTWNGFSEISIVTAPRR